MIVNLTRKQVEQIISMIENASFKGSNAEEVVVLLKTLKEVETEVVADEKTNINS